MTKLFSMRGKMAIVTKKSRGRFPMPLAKPGLTGLVINTWIAHSGSEKLTILTEDLETYCTTLKCVSITDCDIPENSDNLNYYQVSQVLLVLMFE